MRSARPAVGSGGTSGGTASPERAMSPMAPPVGSAAGAAGPAVAHQLEMARRLTQLLDGVINLLAGGGWEERTCLCLGAAQLGLPTATTN